MGFSLAAPSAARIQSNFPRLTEISGSPEGKPAQLGASQFEYNPPHSQVMTPFGISPLITVGEYGETQRWAKQTGNTHALVGLHVPTGEHIIMGMGAGTDNILGIQIFSNTPMAMTDIKFVGMFEAISPEGFLNDLDASYRDPNQRVTRVDRVGAAVHVYRLNLELAAERQAGRLPDGMWYMLPSGDELQYVAQGPKQDKAYGTPSGQVPQRRGSLKDLAAARAEGNHVQWGEGEEGLVEDVTGVLWHWTRDSHPNGNPGLRLGSWRVNGQGGLHPAYPGIYDLDGRGCNVGFRVVLPRTP